MSDTLKRFIIDCKKNQYDTVKKVLTDNNISIFSDTQLSFSDSCMIIVDFTASQKELLEKTIDNIIIVPDFEIKLVI